MIALEVPVAAPTHTTTNSNSNNNSTLQQQQPPLVWDLDLQAPQLQQQQQFPCTLQQYAQHALQAATYDLPPHLQR